MLINKKLNTPSNQYFITCALVKTILFVKISTETFTQLFLITQCFNNGFSVVLLKVQLCFVPCWFFHCIDTSSQRATCFATSYFNFIVKISPLFPHSKFAVEEITFSLIYQANMTFIITAVIKYSHCSN